MYQCKFCNYPLNGKGALGPHSKKCIKYQQFLKLLNKDLLYDLYWNKEYSVQDIADKFNCCHSIINKLLIKYNIKRRNFIQCSSTNKKKQKSKQTNIKKYGYEHNFCKEHPSRKKWQKRLLQEEGIVNVFQREEVKKKSLDTFIKKYKTEKWRHSLTCRGRGVISSLNKEIFNILIKNKIDFSIEFKIKNPNGMYYSYDVLLNNKKIIEIYGDYWHGNPKIYKEDDIILKGSSKEKIVKDKWRYDKNKNNLAIKNGYKILIIWEYDLKNNRENIINRIIKYANSKNKKYKKIRAKIR